MRRFPVLVLAVLLAAVGPVAGEDAESGPRLLGPRRGEEREKTLTREGGSRKTEAAVAAALDWLARHRDPDGGWDADGFPARCDPDGEPCDGIGKGQHGEAVPCPFDDAISAIALLAFLGQGHAPGAEGDPYADLVAKGLRTVSAPRDRWALALSAQAHAEAAALTGDEALTARARDLAARLLDLRQEDGGFGYAAPWRKGSDVPYTALAVQALVAAADVGFVLPDDFATGVDSFLDSLEEKKGKLAYLADGRAYGYTPTTSNAHAAAAIRELLKVGTDGARHRAHLAVVNHQRPVWKIRFREVEVPGRGKVPVQIGNLSLYQWWYGTIATFHHGGGDWSAWFAKARSALTGSQREEGCARGSWDPLGTYERQTGGRILATALGALILEQPYRQRRR